MHQLVYYLAFERVDALMNLLFMVQSFGLLFESLCTHYLIVLVCLQLLRPNTLILIEANQNN